MERSRTIGGIVRNQEGDPVQGAKVLICLRGSKNRDGSAPRIENDIWKMPASTDSAGRGKFHDTLPDFATTFPSDPTSTVDNYVRYRIVNTHAFSP